MNTVTATRFMTQARTFLLLAGLTGLLVAIGGLVGGASGLALFAIFAIGMNLFLYFKSDSLALRMSNAQPLSEQQDPELHRMIEGLAQRAGVPKPRVYMVPQEQPNAFATGRNPAHAAIAVTAGIRKYMPAYQLEGVLAHEFAHIKNRDILIQSVGAMIGGIISGVAQFMLFFGGGDDRDNPLGAVGAILAVILAPIAASLIQLAISRQREYLADATGASFIGNPNPLADALETLEKGAAMIPMAVNPSSEPLYIVNPLRKEGIQGLFSTHPPLAERVRRLRALAV
jgi:heat shock protein HtpX